MLPAVFLAGSLALAAMQAGEKAPSSAVVVASVVPIEKISDGLATDLFVDALGLSGDLISGDFAFHRGCHEGNALAPRPEGRMAMKIGLSAFRGAASYWLRRHGHRSIANVWRWTGLAVDGGVTAWNVACGFGASL